MSGINKTIEAKLTSLRRKRLGATAFSRLGHLALAWGAVLVLLVACAHSLWGRLALQALLVGALGAGLGWLVWTFIRKPSFDALALQVEKRFPHLKNLLVNAVQLGSRIDGLEGYSPELTAAAIQQAEEACRDLDFGKAIPKSPWTVALGEIGVGGIVLLLLLLGFPSQSTRAFSQFLNLKAIQQVEAQAILKVEPGNGKVAKGQSFGIKISMEGRTIREALVHRRAEGGTWEEAKATPLASGRFEHTFESVMEPFEYYVTAGHLSSEHYRVSVSVRPVVAQFKLKAIYPGYAKVPPQEMPEGSGDVTALVGTVVEVSGKANVPLGSAKLAMGDSSQVTLKPEGSQFSGKFVVRKDATYRFEVADSSGEKNEDPPEYRMTAILDESPTIRIAEPGRDIYLPENLTVPLRLEAHDDFGLTRMTIKVKKGSGKEERTVPIVDLKGRVADTSLVFIWELNDLGLLAGEEAVYYAEVYDNDVVSGPKRGVSQTYRVRFPTVQEMYAQSQEEQKEALADLQGSLPAQEELKKEVERIAQELKTQKNLTWEKRQEIEQSLQRQEELLKELEKTSQGLQQAAEKAEQSPLVDMETIQKLQEVQRLMSEVMTEEMRKALQQLQEAMKKADPKMVQEAMKNLRLSQEELKQRLDKTIALLKDVQLEQKLKEAANKAQDLLTRQQALKEATKQSEKKEVPTLAPKQKELKEEAKQLAMDLKSLSDSLQDTHPQVADSLAQLSKDVEGDSLSGAMEQAADQMASQNPQGAMKNQEKAERSLSELSQGIKSAQNKKVGQDKKVLAEKMRNAMKDLLYLSEKQNELNQKMGDAASNPASDKDALAKEQQDLQAGVKKVADQLAEAGQKTMFLTPEIMRQMGGSLSKMGQAQQQLQQGNAGGAKQNGQDAQAGLNLTVMSLMDAMGRMQSSSSASGLQEALEQMAGLSQQQEGVNQGTQGLMPIPGEGQLSLQQRAEMARLAAEQGAIAKGMRDVQRSLEGGGESGLQGRVNEIAKDMEKVAEDLKTRKVDRQTIERQQKILTRLLDAQRSVRERDMTERRKSETAKPYEPKPPKPLPSDLGDQQKKIREALLKALKEGYPPEYEELIRAYFKALVQ